MLLGIDHLVIAVPDPDAAVDALGSLLGLAPGGGGRHPAWGTRNRLLWLGDTFVELLGIKDEQLAARSWLGAPALRVLPSGPALVGWAIASDDLDTDAAGFRALGAEMGAPTAGERRRPDGEVLRWRLALPPAIALDRPFLIEHDPTGAEWTPADRAARAAVPGRVIALSLPVDRIPGLALGAHARTFARGSQRVIVDGDFRQPTIHLTGLGPSRRHLLLGCAWSIE